MARALTFATVRYEVADTGVATIAMDQPDTRNALSDELLGDLIAAFEAARDDDAVRCVVLASTHETTFSSGGNLGRLRRRRAARAQALRPPSASRGCSRSSASWASRCICAVNGHCLAGALGLALACDLIVAGEQATFGTPEINVGVFPFMILALIVRNVPRKKATEMLLLGERIDAREAERLGIVNRVVAAEDFDAAVDDWAQRLAAQVAGAHEAGQGRAVAPEGHGARGRAGTSCAPS